jgi:hypothetical protein
MAILPESMHPIIARAVQDIRREVTVNVEMEDERREWYVVSDMRRHGKQDCTRGQSNS